MQMAPEDPQLASIELSADGLAVRLLQQHRGSVPVAANAELPESGQSQPSATFHAPVYHAATLQHMVEERVAVAQHMPLTCGEAAAVTAKHAAGHTQAAAQHLAAILCNQEAQAAAALPQLAAELALPTPRPPPSVFTAAEIAQEAGCPTHVTAVLLPADAR